MMEPATPRPAVGKPVRHMTIGEARRWLVMASLALSGASLVFFLIAPAIGYPLKYPQPFRLLEILLPVFLGYLGSAAYFLFGAETPVARVRRSSPELLGLLVRGPIVLFAIAIISALTAFGWSNRGSAAPGTGMSMDSLALAMSASMGLLTVITNVIVSYLFSSQRPLERAAPRRGSSDLRARDRG